MELEISIKSRSINRCYQLLDVGQLRTSVVDNGATSTYSANNLNEYSSVTSASSAVTNLGYDSNGNLINGGTIQSGLFSTMRRIDSQERFDPNTSQALAWVDLLCLDIPKGLNAPKSSAKSTNATHTPLKSIAYCVPLPIPVIDLSFSVSIQN